MRRRIAVLIVAVSAALGATLVGGAAGTVGAHGKCQITSGEPTCW